MLQTDRVALEALCFVVHGGRSARTLTATGCVDLEGPPPQASPSTAPILAVVGVYWLGRDGLCEVVSVASSGPMPHGRSLFEADRRLGRYTRLTYV